MRYYDLFFFKKGFCARNEKNQSFKEGDVVKVKLTSKINGENKVFVRIINEETAKTENKVCFYSSQQVNRFYLITIFSYIVFSAKKII